MSKPETLATVKLLRQNAQNARAAARDFDDDMNKAQRRRDEELAKAEMYEAHANILADGIAKAGGS